MTNQLQKSSPHSDNYKAPLEFYELLGAPVFMPSDNPDHYHLIVDRMLDEVRPANLLEVLITISLIEATFEELRLRQVREAAKEIDRANAVKSLIHRKYVEDMHPNASDLISASANAEFKEWKDNVPKRSQIEKSLSKSTSGTDFALMVQSDISGYSNRQALDRSISLLQRRRIQLLKDLDFCRARETRARKLSDDLVRMPSSKAVP